MAVEMTSTGTGSTARIEVRNAHPTIPIEVRVFRIDFDENGQVKETPADGEFLIFPPQALVQPNQRQMVRVQWLGGQLPSSRAYYVSISQLPVQLDPASIDKTSRSVICAGRLSHESAGDDRAAGRLAEGVGRKCAPDHDKSRAKAGRSCPGRCAPQPGVSVTVRNTGKRHAMMAGSSGRSGARGWTTSRFRSCWTGPEMGQLLGAGYLPDLTGADFRVTHREAFSNAPITVKFSDRPPCGGSSPHGGAAGDVAWAQAATAPCRRQVRIRADPKSAAVRSIRICREPSRPDLWLRTGPSRQPCSRSRADPLSRIFRHGTPPPPMPRTGAGSHGHGALAGQSRPGC